MKWLSVVLGVFSAILRSHLFQIILLSVAVLLLSGNVLADSAAPRIMPLGDSITRGWYGSTYRWGYRKPLYDMLKNDGYDFDFVGSAADGNFPDPNHEGHDGWHADQILSYVGGWLTTHQPDVVLLHIGTNDVTGGDQNVNEVNGILNVIDSYETGNNKQVTVILALIINRRIDSPAAKRAATTQFNVDVNNMATSRIANGDDIIVVDMESALDYNISVDMADEVHPNDNGYGKMAAVWYNALVGYFDRFGDFSISGYAVEDDGQTPVEGVLIQTDSGDFNDITGPDGYYQLWVDCNWSGTVRPIRCDYVFEPNSRYYEDINQDYTDQDYTGNKLDFRITGYIRNECNTPIEGASVDANNGSYEDTTDINGFYEVWVDEGWSGTITPSKKKFTFEPNGVSYVDVQADQPGQNYAAYNAYDLNCDGSVDESDFGIMAANWLVTGPEVPGDFVADGVVDFLDFANFGATWVDK
jgi:lysophospholipase L1-like esterase